MANVAGNLTMASLDAVSIGILLGSLLVLAGILSSLVALRFGAPLLLVFLVVGMLAGEAGPGGIKFDDVGAAYAVGSIALSLILFDGGLRTRFATFRSVLAPSAVLATVGVLLTATLTAPVAWYLLGMTWVEALLVGAVVASTDAAAVFFLINAGGLRLRTRVGATLEAESGSNDPFAVLLTVLLVEYLILGQGSWSHVFGELARQAILGSVLGVLGGRAMVYVLNNLNLAQGLHAPFVAAAVVVIFALASVVHGSGFLAVYLAGLVVGNRPTRAHNTVVVFLDAVTWLAQIVMFVLLGLLVWPQRLLESLLPALAIAAMLMLVARPVTVFLCLWPVSIPLAGKDVHCLGRAAWRGRYLSRVDPAARRRAQRLSLLRYRVRGRADLAADPGLDDRTGRQASRRVVSTRQSVAATRGTRPARTARTGNRRLSGGRQESLSAARAHSGLGKADADRPR